MKKCLFLLPLILFNWRLIGQELYQLKLSPVELTEKKGVSYTHRVDHLINAGGALFCGIKNAPYLVKMDSKATLVSNIGQPGGGPGEFTSRILAYAANETSVFALSASNLDRLHHFTSDGRYVGYLTVKPKHWKSYSTGSCNTFGVSSDTVVLSAPPQSGHLAFGYDFNGEAQPIGDLIFDKRDATRLELNPFLNDTLWVFGEDHWYAVLRFDALVLKFDANFNMVNSFRLENPRLDLLKDEMQSLDPARYSAPQAFFRDIKYHQGFLFLMAPKTLIRIDAKTGEIASMYTFFGVDKATTEGPIQELNFKTFSLMEGNRVLLGPAWMWDHYLMEGALPDWSKISPNL